MSESKHVVVGITGGIAAYKACETVSLLKKAGCEVRCVMSDNATEFITPLTLETLSGYRVSVDSFDHAWEIEHIALAKWCDVLVVVPATANTIAKIRCGIADNLLTSVIMATTCPIMLAPAMNNAMWRSAANQENIAVLESRGMQMIGPESGRLACGDADIGRMSGPDKIVAAVMKQLYPVRDLEGIRVLVTAGPTREMLDPVRFLSNRSTGKMGYAIAEAARDRGAEVVLVSGPVELQKPKGIKTIDICSTNDLYGVMMEETVKSDVVIQAAAPADFTPETVSDRKIKKTGDDMTLHLVATPDIAKAIGAIKHEGQILVAFAAETDNVLENAQKKLQKKNLDFIVANDVTKPGAGFRSDTNIVTLVDQDGLDPLPMMSKREVADKILDKVVAIRTHAQG